MEWSVHFQNPEFMERTRFHLIQPDMEPLVRKWCKVTPESKVLDVGCGTGYFTRLLAKDGAQVTGLDMEQPFIDFAVRQNETDRLPVSYVRGDALDLPFADGSFDIVASHTFLTVVPDPEKAISEMLRVLRPGGVLACVTPMSFFPEAVDPGTYPEECIWAAAYTLLYRQLYKAYDKVDPVMNYAGGVKPAMVPSFLAFHGLSGVCAYPLGKLFSLSNAVLTDEEKLTWIRSFEESEKKKLGVFTDVPEMQRWFSKEQSERYLDLLNEKCSWLRSNLKENTIWEWSGGANLLVTGIRINNTDNMDTPGVNQSRTPCRMEGKKSLKEYERSKYKECSPEETVKRIRQILKNNGIEIQEQWVDSGIGNICSVRINIKGTSIGQNGKGTNREYAMASGYAEFMERLQTGYLLPECACAPYDREWMETEKIPEAGGRLLQRSFDHIRESQRLQRKAANEADVNAEDGLMSFLDAWSYDMQDGKLAVIPFKSMKTGSISYIPESILRAYYFTNGSCAGNTRNEALVQGLSEMIERYATTQIMTGRLTPPLIPDEAFASIPVLKHAIDTIRHMDGYDLRIMDASCGIGLPVVAAVLTDRIHAKTVLRFGAHPRFEIALERCLTEILQGRHIDRLETAPVYDYARDGDTTGTLNRFNFMKAAFGQFPVQLYAACPSWNYTAFEEAPEDIEGQLSFLRRLYDRLGWEVYIRDCSFLGFPTYQLVVPGVSMVFDFGKERPEEKRMLFELRRILKGSDGWTWEGLRKARRIAVYKRGFLIENGFSFLSGMPIYPKLLGLELDAGLLAGLTSLALFDRKRAKEFFRPYCFLSDGSITGIYPLVQLLEGNMSEEVCSAMECICGKEQTEAAKNVIRSPEKYLPGMTCPDCKRCPLQQDCQWDILCKAAAAVTGAAADA